jgi:predicted RNA binding protein YcfA (HicA-like mRNA interferase family)
LKVRDIIKEIEADGWYFVRWNGDHRIYRHSTKPGITVVPGRLNGDVRPGTLASIRRQAGL